MGACASPELERLELSETFCRKLREAIGGKADLLFGTHGQFTTSGPSVSASGWRSTSRSGSRSRCRRRCPRRWRRSRAPSRIPVAAGERLTTKYEFARVLRDAGRLILQMDLGRVGGLLEAKKIAAMAETHYAQIAPHLYCGPIVGAANLQLAACSPNFLILESILYLGRLPQSRSSRRRSVGRTATSSRPTAPGLGVEFDEAVADAHPYDRDRLHLDMVDWPL